MELRKPSGVEGDDGLPRVQAVVAARLELLSEEARAVAEVASAIGRDFRFDILEQASDLEEDRLVRALDELWRRHIVRVQADERWDFSHDRIREVTYEAIGPARRRLIHRRIAQGMELLFAERLDEVSASIAMHLDRGGQPARAVPFLERAAAVAMRVSAGEEAIRCLTHALSLHDRAPTGRDRDARELALRTSLSVALNSARGYAAPEVAQNLDRVFTLSRSSGEVPVRWMWAAFTFRIVSGDLRGARDIAEQASRGSRRRSFASTRPARRHGGRTICHCSPTPILASDITSGRSLSCMPQSRWRARAPTAGGFRPCTSRRASSTHRRGAPRHAAARSSSPVRNTAAAWSGALSRRRSRLRSERDAAVLSRLACPVAANAFTNVLGTHVLVASHAQEVAMKKYFGSVAEAAAAMAHLPTVARATFGSRKARRSCRVPP